MLTHGKRSGKIMLKQQGLFLGNKPGFGGYRQRKLSLTCNDLIPSFLPFVLPPFFPPPFFLFNKVSVFVNCEYN